MNIKVHERLEDVMRAQVKRDRVIHVDQTQILLEREAIAAVAVHMNACGLDGTQAETHLRALALEAARTAVAEAVAKSRKYAEAIQLIHDGHLEIGRAS